MSRTGTTRSAWSDYGQVEKILISEVWCKCKSKK